jgi:hypothetical protein
LLDGDELAGLVGGVPPEPAAAFALVGGDGIPFPIPFLGALLGFAAALARSFSNALSAAVGPLLSLLHPTRNGMQSDKVRNQANNLIDWLPRRTSTDR